MSHDPQGFKVTDRRHFAPDGSPRTEETQPEAKDPPVSEGAPAPAPTPEPVDFGSFLLSLAAQASALLGLGTQGGESGTPSVELAAARQIISVLEMLKEKTEGRRSKEEDALLDGLLYELRMAWIARASAK